jgi:WhiB family transcriptional regulator, redox-sensing transcriptional regulator
MADLSDTAGTTGQRARADEAGAAGWRARAACLRLDPALFFPDRVAHLTKDVAAAKAICGRCPVRDDCLRAAMDGGENIGIWGGLTPIERVNLQRRHRRARAAQKNLTAHQTST